MVCKESFFDIQLVPLGWRRLTRLSRTCIAACKKELETGSGTRKQGDAPPGWAMIATHVDDVPGVATSELMIEYILGAIRVGQPLCPYCSDGAHGSGL